MALKRIAFLTFLLWLVIPDSAFGQIPEWLYVSPSEVYQPPEDPFCYTITVGGGEYMTVNLEYYYEGGGPYYVYGWPSLDGNGQAQVCVDSSMPAGFYQFTGVQNSQYPYFFTPIYATLTVYPASRPVIYGLGPGCDDWDCIWVGGANFQQDSYVYVYSDDWSTYQVFWGPAWGLSPAMWMDLPYLAFQITDPALLSSFGNYGVHVLVVNPGGVTSDWAWTRSGPPVITSGAAGCADGYCITLTGAFPLDAVVDFRVPGQPDVITNAYSDLSVTPTTISLRLNPGARHDFDVSGLNAWVVNPLLANWSDGYYISAIDKNITGNIDGITLSGVYYINGWACAKTYEESVDVWIFAGGPAGTGTWVGSATANLSSEPAVAAACNSFGSHYRFSVPISDTITQNLGGQAIFVHGISPIGLTNNLIGNSGTFTVPSVDHSVTGFISGVVLDNGQYYLRGWACAKTYSGSIDVHLYAGGPAGSGTFVTNVTANQSSNPATTSTCNPGGTTYGFSILLTLALRQQFGGQAMYVHGISPFGLPNSLIGNSGNLSFPQPMATSSREYIYIGDRLLAVDITNLP
jgi:hypothetical protein